MNLEAIAKHAQAKGLGVMGRSLFVNLMPRDAEGILLRDGYLGTPVNPYLPGFRERSELQVAVRARDFVAGRTLSWKVFTDLSIKQETQLGDMLVRSLRPVAEPRPFRQTSGGFIEWEIEFTAVYVMPDIAL